MMKMQMTASQKILAAKAGLESVAEGQLINAFPDLYLGNDITAPVALHELEKLDAKGLFGASKTVMVMDHFTPNKDIRAACNCKEVREFCKKYGITRFYDTGKAGIEHALIPEEGLVTAGDLAIGADSHTCTYGALGAFSCGVGSTDLAYAMYCGKTWFKVPGAISVELTGKPSRYVTGKDVVLTLIGILGVDGADFCSLEFSGSGLEYMSMDDRFTIANMAVECGATNAFFPVDSKTLIYLEEHGAKKPVIYEPDKDVCYSRKITLDLSAMCSVVALPHLPSNVKNAKDVKGLKIDQVVIGSCTNGRYSDLANAASVIKGRKTAPGVRLIVIPATQKIWLECVKSGIAEIFVEAGGVFSTPTCGPCLGGHMGILADGERAASTTNRNFVGRMGSVTSEVVLCSPFVAANAAVTGEIYFDPEDIS
jgi:3-isopropylmalate/(R)-2-methylmalate dehydratase large subunit